MTSQFNPKHTSNSQASQRPADLEITPREVDFDYLAAFKKHPYWYNNDPVVTHFFNALQATFPEGERFFIDSARDAAEQLDQAQLDEPFKSDLKAFIKQEALHGRQHDKWTQALVALGYEKMTGFDQQLKNLRIWSRKKLSANVRLSMTAAAEHYTASLAYVVAYHRPDLFQQAAQPFQQLLSYHALEEVEHKAVCFDLYQKTSGNYWGRVIGLIWTTFDLLYHIRARHKYLLQQDGLWDRKHRRQARQFIFGKDGIGRLLWPRLKAYFRRDFHPWETDERQRVSELWQEAYPTN